MEVHKIKWWISRILSKTANSRAKSWAAILNKHIKHTIQKKKRNKVITFKMEQVEAANSSHTRITLFQATVTGHKVLEALQEAAWRRWLQAVQQPAGRCQLDIRMMTTQEEMGASISSRSPKAPGLSCQETRFPGLQAEKNIELHLWILKESFK